MIRPLEWDKVNGSTWAATSRVLGDEMGAFEYRIAATLDGAFDCSASSPELVKVTGSAPFNSLHEAKAACADAEISLAVVGLRRAALLMLEASVNGTAEDLDTRTAAARLRGALALFEQ